ncbi:MAG: NADP-dependent oxidoreductase [Micropruina sp.]|uniref:NADP-dependent oxidoreductase n=1 Tax=Micropruina sp. TaxID=2737536 RepID=UPI0039E6ABFB
MTTTVVAASYGGSEALQVITAPTPEPGPGQVRVEVRAIGANPVDYKTYSGGMMADPSRLPLPLGSEASGVVDAVGDGVTSVAVGDEVIAYRAPGSYTTDLLVPESALTSKPSGLGWAEAAGLLLTGATAWHALVASGAQAGDTVLVHGGAGGVGQMVLQLARLWGIGVVATSGPSNQEVLRELGAKPITYGEGLLDRARVAAPDGYAAALDMVGTDEAIDTSLALVPGDRVISIAAFRRAADGITLIGGGPGADPGTELRNAARAQLAELAGRGDLVVAVDRTYPLTDAAAAHDYLRAGHARGKVILVP